MLQFIRERAQSWIAVAIVALLIIALSVVAWESFFGPDPEVPVSKVNGEKITFNEFQREYQMQRQRLQNMLGGKVDLSQIIPDEDEFKKNILKRMQDDELMSQAATDEGFRISDGLLAQQIRSYDAFHTDGEFDDSKYNVWLAQNLLSATMFEELLRRDALLQQYRSGIADTAWVLDSDRDSIIRLQEQERDIGLLTVAASQFVNETDVSDDDAKAYYEKHSSDYATEEQVSLEYVELSLEQIKAGIKVEDAALQEMYNERASEFATPEERHTRHILFEVAGDASEGEWNSTKENAQKVLEKIKAGASFEEMAKEYSDDFGSADKGGDLGMMGRDSMVDPAFADAAFALKVGEVSDVVQSTFGYHIIKLDAIKPGEQESFDDVKKVLADEYRSHHSEELFFEQSEQLANLTFENPDSLQPAAEELGLTIHTTPLFTAEGGVGLAMNPKIRTAAFSEEVLQQGNNSELLETDTNHLVVVRVKEHLSSKIRSYEEVKAQVIGTVKLKRAAKKAKEKGEALIAQLKDGADVNELAKDEGIAWNPVGFVKRSGAPINPDLLQQAFRMSASSDEKPTYKGVETAGGDYSVVALFSIKAPDTLDEEKKTSVIQNRERYYGFGELLGAIDRLRSKGDIVEYPENM